MNNISISKLLLCFTSVVVIICWLVYWFYITVGTTNQRDDESYLNAVNLYCHPSDGQTELTNSIDQLNIFSMLYVFKTVYKFDHSCQPSPATKEIFIGKRIVA